VRGEGRGEGDWREEKGKGKGKRKEERGKGGGKGRGRGRREEEIKEKITRAELIYSSCENLAVLRFRNGKGLSRKYRFVHVRVSRDHVPVRRNFCSSNYF
jgi:hypothetical protein